MTYRRSIGDLVEVARKEGSGEELSVVWQIRDVLALSGGKDDYYTSPGLRINNECWLLRLWPNCGKESKWMRLGVGRCDLDAPRTVHFSVSVRGSGGVERSRGGEREFSGYCDIYEWDGVCSRSELAVKGPTLLPDGFLNVSFILKSPAAARGNDQLKKEEESCMEQIKTLQKRVETQEMKSENRKKHIRALESEKLSLEKKYNCQLREKLTTISELKKEVESLRNQNKDLNRKCEEQSHFISEASSELKKACMDNEFHKKEMQSLMEDVKNLKMNVEKNQTSFDKNSKQMDTFESENTAGVENYGGQAAFDEDTRKKNSNDDNNKESKVKRNVVQPIEVKKTKRISLPTRHEGVISSLQLALKGKIRTDFTLKSESGEWPVHRVILESRSGHFEALLQGVQEYQVRVDDIIEGAMEVVLCFLYSDEIVNLNKQNLRAVHAIANELNLERLESLCVDFMKEWMCPELVCIALIVADRCREEDLKERALQCYFRESGRVVDTEGWKELRKNHRGIISELFKEFIKRERMNRMKERE